MAGLSPCGRISRYALRTRASPGSNCASCRKRSRTCCIDLLLSLVCYTVDLLSLCVFNCISIRFSLVNGAWGRFRRCIHSIQLEETCASIDEVMGGSSWDKTEALSGNRALLTVHESFPFTADEGEHLI